MGPRKRLLGTLFFVLALPLLLLASPAWTSSASATDPTSPSDGILLHGKQW